MTRLKIGDIARLSGLSVETIRYYERRGLITPSERLPSGYRLYSDSSLQRLSFIQRGKALGFSLEEILELLNLQVDPSTSAAAVKQKVNDRLQLVRQKIRDLQSLEQSLEQLSDLCCGEGPVSDCPILGFLNT